MTKIQRFQLIAVILLIIFVLYSYQSGTRNDFVFYPLVAINLILWILRQRERHKARKMEDDK